jgi:hypothetical protein
MNQPCGHCITNLGQLCIESHGTSESSSDLDGNVDGEWMDTDSVSNMPINDADPDFGPGENADDDWIDTGSVLDMLVGDITEEEVTELYSGASKIYGRGHTFMDTFNADTFSLERKHNLYYPFSSKTKWKFTSWLANSGLSMATIGKCLC